jgi:hypothetical protein
MITPHLTTRSLARLSLFASAAALIFSLTRYWTAPHTPVPTALAAAPKAALAHTLTNRDPATARAAYLTGGPEELVTYTHPVYGFSFRYPKDFTVEDLEDERGELVLVENPAIGMGFQIYITSDDETGPLTAARIHHDLPDMVMDEVVEFTQSDGTAAVRFVSQDAVLGDGGETWFRKDGHVFQLAVSAPDRELQHAWMNEIANNLAFPEQGQEGTSTEL